MTDQAAVRAFTDLVLKDELRYAQKAADLLSGRPGIAGRYAPEDLEAEVVRRAGEARQSGGSGEGQLEALIENLVGAPPTRLLAAFDGTSTRKAFAFEGLWLGPADDTGAQYGLEGSFWGPRRPREDDTLVIGITDAARGRLAVARCFRRLRSALGALYLLAKAAGNEARLGTLPADTPPAAVVVGPGDRGEFAQLSHQFRLAGAHPFRVEEALSATGGVEVFEECVSTAPQELVEQRLSLCAPWLQVGFDALAYSDAVLALGIALEALMGGEKGDQVSDVLAKRCGYLLGGGETPEAIQLSRVDITRAVKRHYDQRSRVVHGSYVFDAANLAKERTQRAQFEALVCDVAVAFRAKARAEGWTTYSDLKDWWEFAQMA